MRAPPEAGWPRPGAHLHVLGICGYAVSGLALCCHQLGYRVTGSDEDAYPPTTLLLEQAGIPFAGRHDPGNLERWGRPDLLILGNQVQAGNPELVAAQALGVDLISEAAAYHRLTSRRARAVICGTHGKTSTSALCAWMLEGSGLEPGFRLGATSLNFALTARLGDDRDGGPFVFEGDEYTTSALDQGAKFLHWWPQVVAVLNLELDHPDLYPDLDAYSQPYRQLLAELPKTGLLIYNAEDSATTELARQHHGPAQGFGVGGDGWREAQPGTPPQGERRLLALVGPQGERVELALPLFGRHNLSNALAALATATALGADPHQAAAAAASYQGAARRFQVLGQVDGVTVVDDYAHHPTKLRATIAAAREAFPPPHQLVMVHVPHTYSRTRALLEDYRSAFSGLDLLVLGPIEPARERRLPDSVSSLDVLARAGVPEALAVDSAGRAIGAVRERLQAPAVVVCSSVRGFDGVAGRLLERLRQGGAG